MKKLALVLVAGMFAASGAYAYKDGTYAGKGQGNASQIEVSVTVKGGKIAEVKMVKNGETPFLVGPAFEKVSKAMVAGNTTQVATMSGATNSSKGIIAAVNDALKAAK